MSHPIYYRPEGEATLTPEIPGNPDENKQKPNGSGHEPDQGRAVNILNFPKSGEDRNELRQRIEAYKKPPDKAAPPNEPAFNLPVGVKLLCLVLIALHAGTLILPPEKLYSLIYRLAFVPGRYAGTPLFDPEVLTIFTHMFLHSGWLHLLVNVGMLMAFGAGIERAVGPWRFFIFFMACGVAGAVTHFFFNMTSLDPMIGASGGISGLFGGILRLMPGGNNLRRLLPFIVMWVGISVFFGAFGAPGSDQGVAWATHVGGFAAGLFLFAPMCLYKNNRRR